MSVQRKPLTGMIAAGVSAPRVIDNAAPTVLHTCDVTAAQQGGAYIDMVTLFVSNATGGAIVVTITALGSAGTLLVSIPANGTVNIFDQQPVLALASSVGTATQILGQGASAGLRFFGWFARPL